MPNYISNFVDSELSSAVKVNQKQKIGIAGFYMMAILDQGFAKSSSVPVVPLENGSYATDHIVQNPLQIRINGTVADIFETPSPAQIAYMRAVAEIGNVDRYLPNRTRQQIISINTLINDVSNQIRKIDDMINTGEQLFDLFSANSESKTLPEKFIDLIAALMDNDQIIQIELPYKVYKNMAITNLDVRHPTEYLDSIEFNITAVQFRFVQTLVEDSKKYYKKPSSAVKDQVASNNNKGINKTQSIEQSGISVIVNGKI